MQKDRHIIKICFNKATYSPRSEFWGELYKVSPTVWNILDDAHHEDKKVVTILLSDWIRIKQIPSCLSQVEELKDVTWLERELLK